MLDDIVRHRLERDLGHDPDDARISVRAGDLRALLNWQAENSDSEEAYERGYNAGIKDTEAEYNVDALDDEAA